MSYRLNLYSDGKLTGTELMDAPLDEAKSLACAALDSSQAHRAELINNAGSILFQRWAVL
jgi:hypothetical protein